MLQNNILNQDVLAATVTRLVLFYEDKSGCYLAVKSHRECPFRVAIFYIEPLRDG